MASKDLSDLPDEFKRNLSNNQSVPERIRNHQKYRFAQLYRLLERDDNINVVIQINTSAIGKLEHGLGKGLAVDQWEGSGCTKKDSDDSIANLTSLVNKLFKKFPKQVKYGAVGINESTLQFISEHINPFIKTLNDSDRNELIGYDKKTITMKLTRPSNKLYHVWGANVTNWNNNIGGTILGLGQASGMGKQNIGIFGVITTPINVDSKNIHEISSQSNTDYIDPYENEISYPSNPDTMKPFQNEIVKQNPWKHTSKNELLFITDKWEHCLSGDKILILGGIIIDSSEECCKCIYDNIKNIKDVTKQIKEFVKILLNSSVIGKDDYKAYMEDIDACAVACAAHAAKVAHQKYLKYKQKYLALKIYKKKL